jgi:hypothetical protein
MLYVEGVIVDGLHGAAFVALAFGSFAALFFIGQLTPLRL